MPNFAAKSHLFLLVAVIVIILGVIVAAVPGGLKLGMDFKGGILMALVPNEEITRGDVQNKLSDLGYAEAADRVQETGDGKFLIRTRDLSEEEQQSLKDGLAEIGTVDPNESGYVSSAVASQATRNAAIATSVAVALMLLYITWAFRKVPHSFRYGTASIVALVFNLVVTVGVFAILGRALGWEIDPMFITALLAIIGYSVNDSIVVLDRIRENKSRGIGGDYDGMVNLSISETLVRSLNTAITTVLAILAVYLIVGGPIRSFLMALFVGVVAGAYSSIFVAGQLLVMWEHGDWIKIIPGVSRLQKNKA
jgi:preprotein translocase subunit SecF